MCKHALEKLGKNHDNDQKQVINALKCLAEHCHDEAVVDELLKLDGITFLANMIEKERLAHLEPDAAEHLLSAYFQAMDLTMQSWDSVSEALVQQVIF